MKVGISISMINTTAKRDEEIYRDEMAIANLAEPLGFDSIGAVEHHFTGYAMIPNCTQLLTFIAGSTKRLTLVTTVIVLPWHDPVRVAEEMAMLDVLSEGRTIFGFGRGAARTEYDGFRIPMEEARDRFKEACEIVIKGLTQESFSYQGQFFNIPEIQIRPRPISNPVQRLYAASVSPESADMMARLGLGVFIIAQKDWDSARGGPAALPGNRAQHRLEAAHSNRFQPDIGGRKRAGGLGRRQPVPGRDVPRNRSTLRSHPWGAAGG